MANLVQKSGKAASPEKSNFAQTCNRFSQYLKERGSFGDLSLGINGNLEAKAPEASRPPATTLNLLSNIENSAEVSSQKAMPFPNIKPTDYFSQSVGFAPTNPIQDSTAKSADLRKSSRAADPGTAQLTIFYAGQVIAYDDFPADKAKEIMALASKASANTQNGFNTAASTSAIDNIKSTLQLQPQAIGSGLQIVTRVSLHRFFEKRKERVASKAPYQLNNPSSSPPARPRRDEQIDLEDQSWQQLELKL